MPDTIQAVLSDHFAQEAEWRRRKYEIGQRWGEEDVRERLSSEWLGELSRFVGGLPDEDPGMQTLRSFRWASDAFGRGTGAEARQVLSLVGFKGTRSKPLEKPASGPDLEKAWGAYVRAAERDFEAAERVAAIAIEHLLADTQAMERVAAIVLERLGGSRARALEPSRSHLGRFWARGVSDGH